MDLDRLVVDFNPAYNEEQGWGISHGRVNYYSSPLDRIPSPELGTILVEATKQV